MVLEFDSWTVGKRHRAPHLYGALACVALERPSLIVNERWYEAPKIALPDLRLFPVFRFFGAKKRVDDAHLPDRILDAIDKLFLAKNGTRK